MPDLGRTAVIIGRRPSGAILGRRGSAFVTGGQRMARAVETPAFLVDEDGAQLFDEDGADLIDSTIVVVVPDPTVDGMMFGARYFGHRYFGAGYFG